MQLRYGKPFITLWLRQKPSMTVRQFEDKGPQAAGPFRSHQQMPISGVFKPLPFCLSSYCIG